MKKIFAALLILVGLLSFSGISRAALINIGTADYTGSHLDPIVTFNLIYDDVQQLTWFDYVRPAANWQPQLDWATGLTLQNLNLNPFYIPEVDLTTGWILPSIEQLENLYAALTAPGAGSPFDPALVDTFWSSTNPGGNFRPAFDFFAGQEVSRNRNNKFPALAARPGAVNAVPEPGTILLLGSGLAGIGFLRKKLKTKV